MDVWTTGKLRLFISHSSVNKVAVAELTAALSSYGVHGFVAHEDIEPTAEWAKVIDRALRTCHAMLAYVTTEFKASSWTGQEVGYCLERQVPLVSVRMDADPPGFLAARQALPGKSLSAADLAKAVFEILAADPRTATRCSTAIAYEVMNAASFGAVKHPLRLAEEARAWSPAGLKVLQRAKSENYQVYGASYGDYPGRIDRIVAAATIVRHTAPSRSTGKHKGARRSKGP